MSGEYVRAHLEKIRQQIAALQRQDVVAAQAEFQAEFQAEVEAALDNLEIIDEEKQASLEVAEIIEENLLAQNQHLKACYQHYYDLFQSLPIPYLITDASGLILEANQAIATLLNLPQRYLIHNSLRVFLVEEDQEAFSAALAQLPQSSEGQTWKMSFSLHRGESLPVEMQVTVRRDGLGQITTLQIVVFDRSQVQRQVVPSARPPAAASAHPAATTPALPLSLDGLRVLFVDDEADAREFVTAVLEAQGVRVTAVDSAAAALAAIEQHRPDILVIDIRMADQDGYALIRRVRELEAQQGGHVPAAALTSYLNESREKALTAGFDAHLHKLVQPSELVKLVSQLSGRSDS